jgi:hypothetical protein
VGPAQMVTLPLIIGGVCVLIALIMLALAISMRD